MTPNDPRYSSAVLALCRAPTGAGRPSGAGWVHGDGRDPLTGTHIRVYLSVNDREVTDARFELRGCPHTMAALVWLMPALVGQTIDVLSIDFNEIIKALSIPADKRGRLLLIEDAIRMAKLTVLSSPS